MGTASRRKGNSLQAAGSGQRRSRARTPSSGGLSGRLHSIKSARRLTNKTSAARMDPKLHSCPAPCLAGPTLHRQAPGFSLRMAFRPATTSLSGSRVKTLVDTWLLRVICRLLRISASLNARQPRRSGLPNVVTLTSFALTSNGKTAVRSNCTAIRTTYACHVYSAIGLLTCIGPDHSDVHPTSSLGALPALIDSGGLDHTPDCSAIPDPSTIARALLPTRHGYR